MTYTLTTPLYYVNDKPHLGSAYTTLACDALARFQRLIGEPVLFITGCDEHGQKIQRTAEAAGLSPQAHCDAVSAQYRELWQRWQISNDRLIRTTDPRHRRIVEQFFARVEANGDIVEGRQQGWYCVACEEFKDEPATAAAPQCPIHQRPLEWRDELNLFFRLSRYQESIEALIAQPGFIQPVSRRNEVENFVRQGLRDFSISRVNLPWGIPVPGHDGHTFYVWFDALLGYITALLEEGDAPDLDLAVARGWPYRARCLAMASSPGRARRWANPSATCWIQPSCWSGAAVMRCGGTCCATSPSVRTVTSSSSASSIW